jgi:hypothetical protein
MFHYSSKSLTPAPWWLIRASYIGLCSFVKYCSKFHIRDAIMKAAEIRLMSGVGRSKRRWNSMHGPIYAPT